MGIPGYFKAMLKFFQKTKTDSGENDVQRTYDPTTVGENYDLLSTPGQTEGIYPKIDFVKNTRFISQTLRKRPNLILLDSNSIIYQVKNEKKCGLQSQKLKDGVVAKIQKIIDMFSENGNNPTVYVSFDGVAPLAKLEQQRQRRYRSVYNYDVRHDIGRVIEIGKKLNDPSVTPEDKELFEQALEGLDKVVINTEGKTNTELAQMLGDADPDNKFPYEENTYDTTGITAGTDFMEKISQDVKSHFSGNSKVVVSGSNEPGEGEYKCFEYLRKNVNTIGNERGCTLVYGVDADLFMLAFTHLYDYGEIYLFREIPEEFYNSSLTCISETIYDPNELYLIDIPYLFSMIAAKMAKKYEQNSTSFIIPSYTKQKRLLKDYVLLSMFFGNDFIPRLPTLHFRNTRSINDMFQVYNEKLFQANTFLCEMDGSIEWSRVLDLLRGMKEKETNMKMDNIVNWFILFSQKKNDYISRISSGTSSSGTSSSATSSSATSSSATSSSATSSSATISSATSITPFDINNIKTPNDIIKKLETIPTHEIKLENYILSGNENSNVFNPDDFRNFSERYYTNLFGNVDKNSITKNYLDGLQWTMNYYTIGCVNVNWKYNYCYPPLAIDMYEALYKDPYRKNPFTIEGRLKVIDGTAYLDSKVSLAYVLPKKSFIHFPRAITTKMQEQLIETGLYPDAFNFLWPFQSYFDDSCVILPEINIKALSDIILKK
jgi:5'-3' exonuclease